MIESCCFQQCLCLTYFYYLGDKNPSHGDDIFTNTPIDYVFVQENYQDDEFCGIPVRLPFSNSFTINQEICPNFVFTKSNEFSQSETFSNNINFSPSNDFSNNIYETTIQTHLKTTYSISYSLTFVKKRSVSFSLSFALSNSYFKIIEQNSIIFSLTQSLILDYFPYIIYFYSPTYVRIDLLLFIDNRNRRITPEKLIGITCGSAAIFFFILALIIFIIQKKNEIKNISDSFSISSEYSNDKDINDANNNYNNENSQKSTSSNEGDIDFWI